jgi:cytochrome c oxidase cbb3-type subunit 2
MAENKKLYSNALIFSLVAAVVVLIGTVVTMFYPMFTAEMHPKLENLKPYTALQLAGRDIYQREGCVNCHTQTVRPLKSDVLMYGDYSKAGEFAYDRPFLWGSKRTGPDLARVGGKYPDEWHYQHMENPQAFFEKSNMPKYAFLSKRKVAVEKTISHMKALGFPYDDSDIETLKNSTEMDAIVAYLQQLGSYVTKKAVITVDETMTEDVSPLSGDPEAIAKGEKLYKENCAACHGQNAEGNIGGSLVDYASLGIPDRDTYLTIANGIEGAMPGFAATLDKEKIWSIVEFIKSLNK